MPARRQQQIEDDFADRELYPINTENQFTIAVGENLPNHSESLKGRAKFVRVTEPTRHGVIFRTQQEVYRFCAHLLRNAGTLPSEPGDHSLAEIQEALEEALRSL